MKIKKILMYVFGYWVMVDNTSWFYRGCRLTSNGQKFKVIRMNYRDSKIKLRKMWW